MLGISKSLNSELVLKSPHTESIFCKINRKGKPPIIVGCVYRPPEASLELCKIITREIYQIKSKFKNSVYWVGGRL